MFGVFRDGFLHRVLNGSFYKPSNADFCFHSNFFAAALAVIRTFLAAHIIKVYLTVAAHIAWCVVGKHIQRIFAGVEAFLAQFSGGFFVGLADFVLEIAAFEVFVKSFIHFHGCFPPA